MFSLIRSPDLRDFSDKDHNPQTIPQVSSTARLTQSQDCQQFSKLSPTKSPASFKYQWGNHLVQGSGNLLINRLSLGTSISVQKVQTAARNVVILTRVMC